ASAHILLGSSVAALLTYGVVRLVLSLSGKGRVYSSSPDLTGHLERDLELLSANDPSPLLRRHSARQHSKLEMWSTTLPLAAISLLTPLTLHYFAALLMGSAAPRSYSEWIRISLVIVGHAHLTLMYLAIRFGRKLVESESDKIANMSIHSEWAKAWAITILVSGLPGVVLFAVPPILVAITGIVFIPFMFTVTQRRVLVERALVALQDGDEDGVSVLAAA